MNLEELRQTAQQLMGQYSPDDGRLSEIADRLSDRERESGVTLSAYGFIMWAFDHYGFKCAYKNMLGAEQTVAGYADEAVRLRDDMPAMLVNAHMYVTKIMSNVADMDTCFRQLEGMTFPYVLYVLFAGSGQQAMVERYKEQTREQLRRFPSILDSLPETYKAVAKEFEDADA